MATVHRYCTQSLVRAPPGNTREKREREDLTDKMLLSEAENPCEAQLTYLFEVKKK